MMPLIRLYTASGYFLTHRMLGDVQVYDEGEKTYLACSRSNSAAARSRFPEPNSARTITSQVDGYRDIINQLRQLRKFRKINQ